MRLPFMICVTLLATFVLGVPISNFQPGDVVHVPHDAVVDQRKCTLTMKFDGNKTRADIYFVVTGMVFAGPHPVSNCIPEDAYLRTSNVFSNNRQDLGPNTVKVHGDYLTPHNEARPMDPTAFQKFRADRAKFQPKAAAVQPEPRPAGPGRSDAANTNEKRKVMLRNKRILVERSESW